MKIMNEYTYHQIKKNKRHTISILTAIIIASALLFSLCIFSYSYWQGKIDAAIKLGGNWHGELYESMAGEKLDQVKENSEVETMMIKGNWMTVKLSSTKRPYLLMRDGNSEFWKDMNLKNTIIKGRVPLKEGEIVVAKQFFLDNPDYKIGDSMTLPIGTRMLGNKELGTRDYKQEKETFQEDSSKVFQIVGMMDVSGTSAYPGYIAMGYLSLDEIQPTDELTVYLRFKHPRNIYKTLPEVAKEAGLKKNSKGQYNINYNTTLLNLYAISENNHLNTQFIMIATMGLILLLLVMGTFVLIIYNAFSLSAGSRVRELSILKSLGATPKQIKFSVLYEGFLLWLVQVPVGILIGFAFSHFILKSVNEILSATEDYVAMKLVVSWQVVVIALMISMITVLLSAYIPARKMAKVPAVEGIQSFTTKKKLRDHKILYRLFGMEGELAGRQFAVNRKSLKTAVLSLSLCIVLVVSYLSIITIFDLAESKDRETKQYDITADLNIMDAPDEEMLQSMCSLPEVKESVMYRQVDTAAYVTAEQESKEFKEAGGFESVDMKYSVQKVKDKYKIIAKLVGLSDDSFKQYCERIGTEPAAYYDTENIKGILYDNTYHAAKNSNDLRKMPMLKWQEDTAMRLHEKADDLSEGNSEWNVTIKNVTKEEPGALGLGRYRVAVIVPMEVYQQVTAHFSQDRALEVGRMTIDFKAGDKNSAKAKAKIDALCNDYLGSDDYSIWTLLEEKHENKIRQKAVSIAVYGIAVMFGIIGLFNACSTITNNLLLHKRDYAMLRSIGLTPGGLNKMLFLEGILFVLSPILLSLPCILLICRFMLNVTAISWAEYMGACPLGGILIYLGAMVAAIFLAYIWSAKAIKRDNVIESIQNEII